METDVTGKPVQSSFLSGKWGIAILAMMAAPALNTIGTMAAIKLFPGDSFLAWLLGEAFSVYCFSAFHGDQYRI